jgi:hypothetical protein
MELRFPDVPAAGALYESVYTVLTDPVAPRSLWIRTTVRKRRDEPATGAVWFSWFHDGTVQAGKVADLPVSALDGMIAVGGTKQGPVGSRGLVALPTLEASWEVEFTPDADPLDHLAPSWLYRSPLPRTKATSPVPSLHARGTASVDGTTIDVTGWNGMVGHNWGREHAARWGWLRASGLGDAGDGWLDAILGRVKVAGRMTPWTAFGTLCLDGRRHRLGGLLRRGTTVELRPDGADIDLAGDDVRLALRATVELPSTVGWEYADPGGGRHEVVNCSVASMELEVERSGRTSLLRPEPRGVLELGGDTRAFEVPLQPFAD